MEKEQIQQGLERVKQQHGEWTGHEIHLGHGIWTRPSSGKPYPYLQRMLEVVQDLSLKPLAQSRVLDLACLEGQFALEFARAGATVVGVEGRLANVAKADFARAALGLANVAFHEDDVRNVSRERYGQFDAVLCSGILYHLTAGDSLGLLRRLQAMAERMVVIDTHVSLVPSASVTLDGFRYRGHFFDEHAPGDSSATRLARNWASLDNPRSFWFTRPALINLLRRCGFVSVHECLTPPIRRYRDRCTFVALNGRRAELAEHAGAASESEAWEEGDLAYAIGVLGHLRRLGHVLPRRVRQLLGR